MKIYLITLIGTLLLLISCGQNPQSTNKIQHSKEVELSIPFASMTITYLGKNKTDNKSGKVIFEKERLIMQGLSSKEAFYIKKISQAENILTFQTENSQNEVFSFYIEFGTEYVSEINLKMLGMDGTLNISENKISYSTLSKFYESKISRCNCNLINRSDGMQIKTCDPLPVSSDNKIQIALSLMSNSSVVYGTIAIRFLDNKISDFKGGIDVILENGDHISHPYTSQQRTIIGDSEVQLAIFELSENDLLKMKISEISVISFKLSDNITRTFEAHTNKNVFIKHLDCLQ